MNIARVELFRYALPFVEAMHVGDRELVTRSGLLVRITGDHGAVGHGEIAPLPGCSPESLGEAAVQAQALAAALEGQPIPEDAAALGGAFDRWWGATASAGSVRFGFELAVLHLLAASGGLPLRRLIDPGAPDSVGVAGLLSGNLGEIRNKAGLLKRDGYRAVKLKVGRYPLEDDVSTTRWLCDHLGPEVLLRLDANCAWEFDQAVGYARECWDCHFDYIEEPVSDPGRLEEFAAAAHMQIALDESLRDTGPDEVRPWPGLKALVLKPTVLGLEKSVRLARQARAQHLTPVFSSCYETGFGLIALAEIAAALQPEDAYAGLDTYEWLDGDILRDRAPLRTHTYDLTLLDGLQGQFDEARIHAHAHV